MKEIKQGTVFSFAPEGGKLTCGQVIRKNGKSILVVVFENELENFDFSSLDSLKPALLANTFTARFKIGAWKRESELPLYLNNEQMPIYKVNTNEGLKLIDYDGCIIGDLSKDDDKYFYETYISPIRVEKAIESIRSGNIPEEYKKLFFCNYVK